MESDFSAVYLNMWLIFFIAFWSIGFITFTIWSVLTNPVAKIHRAVLQGNIDLVKQCLRKGVKVNYCQNKGISPLCLAAAENRQEIAELLISYGADVNQGLNEEDGVNPLLSAAIGNHLELVEILLKHGARKGLHLAALQGNIDTVKTFLERQSFQIDSKRNGGMTPLHLAAIGGHRDMAEFLLDNGARVDFSTLVGLTPLYQAVLFDRIEVVDLLIDRGADPNRALALHTATRHNNPDMARLLIGKGVDVNYTNNGLNESPLHEAAKSGFLEIAEILLAGGAQINIQSLRETPLHYASKKGHLDIVKLLVYNGAKININDGFLGTPLDYAVSYKRLEIIDFLRQNGGVERSMSS